MNMNKVCFFLICFCMAFVSKGQDIHFSQFNSSYLNLNPASTGNFDGDYRLNGNFRNQWNSVSEPFQTFSFSAEAKQLLAQYPALDMGLLLFNDEAGVGGLQTINVMASAAYSIKLNHDSSIALRGGIQLGLLSRSVNFDRFTFDEQFRRGRFDGNRDNGENFDRDSHSSFNFNLGFLSSYRLEHRKKVSLGFSLFNLSTPNQSFNGSNIPLDIRSSFHLGADYFLSDQFDLLPSIIHSRQGPFSETVFGSNLRYRMSESGYYKRNLYGGVWYRNRDAIIISAGMDYDQWKVGLSYDINTSDLEVASNNRGGIEVSVTYIIKKFKPQIRRYKLCPKFL